MQNQNSMNIELAFNESKKNIQNEINNRFNDASYRLLNETKVTADQLWRELREAQETPTISAAYTAASILNQLAARGQHEAQWL